jgi:REP element-mobilizing transposase RayT
MTTGWGIRDPLSSYFLTFTVVDWVDVFTRKIYRDIVLDSFQYCRENKGLQVWGYIIMSNHVHTIMSAKNGNLPAIIRDLKRHTASKILKEIQSLDESRRDWMMKRFEFSARSNVRNSEHQFWTHDNRPIECVSDKFTSQKLNYIHMNPVRAGLVEKAEDWLYSSARNYLLLPGLVEIDLLELTY